MSRERVKKRLRRVLSYALALAMIVGLLPVGRASGEVKAAIATLSALVLNYNGDVAGLSIVEGGTVPVEDASAYSIIGKNGGNLNGVTLTGVAWSYSSLPDRTNYYDYMYTYDTNHKAFIAGKTRLRITFQIDSGIESADSLAVEFLGSKLEFTKSSSSTSTTLIYDHWYDVEESSTLIDISGTGFTFTFPAVTYTGEAVCPEPTVKYGSKTLERDVDYTLWGYANNINAGTGSVTITGMGNYKYSVTKDFTISPKNISGVTVSAIPDQTFTGSAIEPELTVKDGEKTLTKGTDYAVTFSNNTNVGTASVTITGQGNYTGQVPTKTFNIVTDGTLITDSVTINYADGLINIKEGEPVPIAPEKYSIEGGTVYTFSSLGWWNVSKESYYGSGDKFAKGDLKLYLNLEAPAGFTFPDSLKVTFNGSTSVWKKSGEYAKSYVTTVTVPGKDSIDISSADVEISYQDPEEETFDYTGEAIVPEVTVKLSSETLVRDTDYTVSYNNNINATTKDNLASLTIQGIGDYSGIIQKTFRILPVSISFATVSDIPDQKYTGSNITPALTVKYNAKTLVDGTDYTAAFTNNTNVGTASVDITGTGNYKGYKTGITFNIVSDSSVTTDISNAVIGAIADQTYTGSAITPAIKVTYGGATLVNGTDYTAAYTNNTNAGTATVTITGKGSYSGTNSATFKIVKSEQQLKLENAKTVADSASLDYAGSEEKMYKVKLVSDSYLQFKTTRGSYYDDAVTIKIYDSNGIEIQSIVQEKRLSDSTNQYVYDSVNLPTGTYYIGVSGDGSGSNSISLAINEVETNVTSEAAETIELPYTDATVNLNWKQTKSGNTRNKKYYKLVVKDKAYYSFTDLSSGGASGSLYKGDSESGEMIASSSEIFFAAKGPYLLEKGTYLLWVMGVTEGKEYEVDINCRDFIDIKSISGTDYYEVYNGSKTPISLTFDPADNESSIVWTSPNREALEINDYDYDTKDNLAKNKAYIYAKSLGKYTATITTSEGISKTITVMVKPSPTKLSGSLATTSSKKKAKLKLEWEHTGNYYKIYEKSGKDYKVISETTSNSITLNKAPGKTYNYKIEACYKKDGQIVCSTMGDAVGAITAPYKAPTIKSAKQSGKTKYVKPFTTREKHWNGYYYYWETHKQGNYSTAAVKVKFTKAKGAKYYEVNKGGTAYNGNAWTISKNKLTFSYKGKIKGKTEKIKLRGIWVKGNSIAYGPWSKVKKAKIKGNK